ncbi:S8 family serine peptidase [Flavisolibacter ginsenosidimutans]|uniref:S8 family serine peptidase n=1 Tax=Flavisolibacter ginsenosidimutans TaxID=661481 RepID=A0A5B8UDH8_9BACT|nr:S8 family serine peptidase [Flavisolibacter ginsenosidimutans]QEC54543.1 S8 family serine peptidase [Flavisolibacter ginsenosidimutans]
MAKKKASPNTNPKNNGATATSASVEQLLTTALERGSDTLETGRYIVTFKEGAGEAALDSFSSEHGLRVADARDFKDQAAVLEAADDADVFHFPEIGAALISGGAAQSRSLTAQAELTTDSPYETIEPEYFAFSDQVTREFMRTYGTKTEKTSGDFLRGFLQAAEMIAREFGFDQEGAIEEGVEAEVVGATWGLNVCKVPPSVRSGLGIRVAVLDTGFALNHPDFIGRPIASATFVGQPVQDLNGHGTHTAGTACGPKAPAGTTPRYGIGYRASMFIGKVLQNNGSGTTATVLAGMNWAIANRCPVISMSLGAQTGVQAAYTAAGQSALNNGLLMIAAAGNAAAPTGAPANSPTIMSVAALDQNLRPASFSDFGKIEIAGPGVDVFSSWYMPVRYKIISGTSMATPHVSGCAALWAETSPNLRALNLWKKLQATAKHLPYPATRVGAGLVQAP